jgi:lon-related putative ATP-dependent protease
MSEIKANKLSVDKLRKKTDVASFGFNTTSSLDCLKDFIGQERAVSAMSFGLAVKGKGYNIFVAGDPGSGRTTYANQRLNDIARKMPAPDDWIYVYNFDDPSKPLSIRLKAGKAREMESSFETLIEELKVAISKAFEKSQYEDSKAQLVKSFQEEVNELMEKVRKWASEKGFTLKRTPQGFVNIPMKEDTDENGETITREIQQEEFEKMDEAEQKELEKRSEEVSQKTLEVLRTIRDKEKTLKKKISDLEEEICRAAVTPYLEDIKEKYSDNEKLGKWIDSLAEDIVNNFNLFVAAAKDESEGVDLGRYSINVFVSNDPDNGAPVVWSTNPTYYNLIGKLEYESRQGYLYTDFHKIIAGDIHRANGGYLLLDAEKVLRNFMSWDALKRVLNTGEITVENLGEQYGSIPVSSLRPQPVGVDVKVVIVGTRFIYRLLQIYDPEFQKMFKIKADFDIDMPRNEDTEKQMARFVAGFVQKEKGTHPFTCEAVGEVIDWASRLAEHQNRMSTQFNRITEVVIEASAWAQMDEAENVSPDHVYKAIKQKKFRSNLVQERIERAYQEGQIKIETSGQRVGQINGLSVVSLGDYAFGHPSRITANVYMGKEGIVNIEREVKMAGPIHNKGLLTLTSYLGRRYAQDMPLSLTARLSFEQNYGGIEGDSASSTELYCLLSALSDIPLKQNIAVTGSVDQFGNIQPIGGVNEKIEGFFDYCRYRGLTGDQGVMIPKQNEINLMLSREVIDAVEKGQFHIWTVEDIDQGIELLTGEKAGIPDEQGNYPESSIHFRVRSRLNEWTRKTASLSKALPESGEDGNEKEKDKEDKEKNSDK